MADPGGAPDGWLPYEQVHGPHHAVFGTVLVWPTLHSAGLARSCEILVYLPPSLTLNGPGWHDGRRYPTLYFHDGQNVFDAHTSYSGEWHADETLEQLALEGLEAIAVAVPNAGEARIDEYMPWRERSTWMDPTRVVGGRADAYLEWLVGSVKALVDRSFPTSNRREATGLAGSSLGGLISIYGMIAQPHVFGLACVMSPAIHWHDHGVARLIEQGRLPAPARVHVDVGGREGARMTADARRLRNALLAAGMELGRDLSYVEDPDADHNEAAWAARLPDALRFLLDPFKNAAQRSWVGGDA